MKKPTWNDLANYEPGQILGYDPETGKKHIGWESPAPKIDKGSVFTGPCPKCSTDLVMEVTQLDPVKGSDVVLLDMIVYQKGGQLIRSRLMRIPRTVVEKLLDPAIHFADKFLKGRTF